MAKDATPYDARWRKVRVRILRRDGWLCQIRGPECLGEATEVDHIVPWRTGGAWYDEDNLRAACRPCNLSVRWLPTSRKPSREW